MADPIIKIGSTGEAVRKAQHALYCRRYLVDLSEVDGVFGPITRNRVIRYQLDRSVGEFFAFSFPLAVDGIVGPMTWSRLTPPVIKPQCDDGVVDPVDQELTLGRTDGGDDDAELVLPDAGDDVRAADGVAEGVAGVDDIALGGGALRRPCPRPP